MVPISIRYLGDLHCEAVHGPSGMRLTTDAPVDNHGRGASFSPTDLMATSYGVCMSTIMGIFAQQQGIALGPFAVEVEKHMSQTPPRRIARLVLRFTMPTGISAADRVRLEATARQCPVALSTHADVVIDATFTWP
jgi:putative redox protein